MEGVIKKWIAEKNFGFIDTGEEKDLFFHKNEVAEGYTPEEGDKVEFEKASSDKGPKAINVKKIGEAAAEETEPAEETPEETVEPEPAEDDTELADETEEE